jgi:bifunctional non-homologous end joining protein LigD
MSSQISTGAGAASRPALPRFVAPLMPTLVSEPPAGEGWLDEIKHDGFRTLIAIDGSAVRAYTRNGHDWTDRYSRVVAAAEQLACGTALIDGEMIVQDECGAADFRALRGAIEREPHRLVLFAFDLLFLNGRDLRQLPLIERKAKLRDLIPAGASNPIQYCEAIEADGAEVFAAADRLDLEGIVSKQATSRYRSGPSKAWLKTKCMTESEFTLVGMEANPGGPPYALLARETDEGLAYAGSAFVTLPQPERDRFWTRAEKLAVDRAVIPELRKGNRKATFTRPEMRVRARHLRGEEMLRHASLTALLA